MTMREDKEALKQYEDMLNLPHHVSEKHPQMSMPERAAQFSPFAALTGYGDAVRETARLTDEFIDLDENSRESLDRKLAVLQEHLAERPVVTVLFFEPDDKKSGGAYQSVSGIIKKIDTFRHRLVMEDGQSLSMEYMIQLDGELFDDV